MTTAFERRPKLTLSLLVLAIILIIIAASEVFLRLTTDHQIDYYTGVKDPKPGTIMPFPFGDIAINSFGYPDSEFDMEDSRPRIGYIGDSVTLGIGAGQGYRFSDLLEKELPAYQHMTFAQMSYGVQDIEQVVEKIAPFDIGTLIYTMNLNDILPYVKEDSSSQSFIRVVRGLIYNTVDVFRSTSYVYNFIRTRAKLVLYKLGYESHGFKAYELSPIEHDDVLRSTASRILSLSKRLKSDGIKLCILIPPYEMQISQEAEDVYKASGIQWEEAFIERETQKRMLKYLSGVDVLDAYPAFVAADNVKADRDSNRVGEYFVYNKGDKLDWNHPNRAGHRKITDYILGTDFCSLDMNP